MSDPALGHVILFAGLLFFCQALGVWAIDNGRPLTALYFSLNSVFLGAAVLLAAVGVLP